MWLNYKRLYLLTLLCCSAEAAIKIAEEEIKQLEPLKLKLKEDNDKKQLELSRKTIDYELLLKQKEIWTELHKKTWSSLCEKKSELVGTSIDYAIIYGTCSKTPQP